MPDEPPDSKLIRAASKVIEGDFAKAVNAILLVIIGSMVGIFYYDLRGRADAIEVQRRVDMQLITNEFGAIRVELGVIRDRLTQVETRAVENRVYIDRNTSRIELLMLDAAEQRAISGRRRSNAIEPQQQPPPTDGSKIPMSMPLWHF